MAYNSGSFSLFSQTGFTTSTQIYGQLIKPKISPPAGVQYTNVYASFLAPSVQNRAIKNVYGLSVGLTMNAASKRVGNAYSLFIQPPSVSSGTLTNVYSLYVTDPVNSGGSAFGQQLYSAYIGGATGIGTASPKNALDVAGPVAVGTYAGVIQSPGNSGMLVSGGVAVGTTTPTYQFDVEGLINTLEILAPATTINNQSMYLAQGTDQGYGVGLPGTNLTLSTTNTLAFDTAANVIASSKGFSGGIFDGRYIYMVPYNNGAYYGQITRYDTFGNFSSSSSYAVFNTSVLNANDIGFSTASFDGRYVYFMSYTNGSVFTSRIIRYDTTQYFTVTFSYSTFAVGAQGVVGDKRGYKSSFFDGKYVYFIAEGLEGITYFGTILRYDISQPFTSASSYVVFDTTLVNVNSRGFFGAAYDGQYLYLAPYLQSSGVPSGLVTQFDTTQSFSVSTSYRTFDLTLVNSNCVGFQGAVFDGRFIYFCNSSFNYLTRYDTFASFSSSSSYQVMNIGVANSWGGGFDGRYLYLVGPSLITRYDSSLPFTYGTSYSSLTITNSFSRGTCFDGANMYFFSGATSSGIVTKMPANPGPPATALAIGYSVGNFTVTGNLSLIGNTDVVATSGSGTLCPTLSSGFLVVNINGTNQRIPYF